MISYKKESELPLVVKDDNDRFEQIRKAAAERHRKSDTDGARAATGRRPTTINCFE